MFLTRSISRVFIFLLCISAVALFFSSSWYLSFYFLKKPRLSACDKCLTEDDPWFRELITSSPKPFLSKYITSEEVFNWWKLLQREQRNFTFYNATVDNLFKMFRPIPDVLESSPDRCRSCAVVGNSVNLKGSHYGPLIDFHDIVMRMNHGRTKGYEADVGTKTTHHLMYPESAIHLDNTTHLVLTPFKMQDLLWLHKTFDMGKNTMKSKSIANKDMVMILNPAFMKYVHDNWLQKKGKYPSTGFLTLALSMHICDEVSVFGFGADSEGNWSHYFERLQNKKLKTGPHAGMHEYEIVEQLYMMQKIQFFKGW
ncbi:CMP-N-acetylneuraminate-beta-galactosamide-alpha-2,3-sialyltransferase 1-like [Channa argus]|uniref:CMP-N-acetylneuraminate-beta-galactosamide- alpha-2,3-sialyltransferase 1-like n=1 Tax=Channa argus TaxID=215402 RepID=UPI00352027F7